MRKLNKFLLVNSTTQKFFEGDSKYRIGREQIKIHFAECQINYEGNTKIINLSIINSMVIVLENDQLSLIFVSYSFKIHLSLKGIIQDAKVF